MREGRMLDKEEVEKKQNPGAQVLEAGWKDPLQDVTKGYPVGTQVIVTSPTGRRRVWTKGPNNSFSG